MDTLEMLQKVARALGPLLDEVVFVGGAMPALLVTNTSVPDISPTKDVDLIVDSRSLQGHAEFERKLSLPSLTVATCFWMKFAPAVWK